MCNVQCRLVSVLSIKPGGRWKLRSPGVFLFRAGRWVPGALSLDSVTSDSFSSLPGYQFLPRIVRKKGNSQGVALSLLDLLARESGSGSCDLELVA